MTVDQLVQAIQTALKRLVYLRQLEILDHSASLIKARLHIRPELFIQIYRNDRFDTTNLALIHNGQRIYARDQVGGNWHRHTWQSPVDHDVSPTGRQPIELSGFLDEVETILAQLGLP